MGGDKKDTPYPVIGNHEVVVSEKWGDGGVNKGKEPVRPL